MSANDPTMRVDIVDESTWGKILEAANNPLPKSTASDKGKYLHLNESSGKTEWAEGGSGGGGVLVVHLEIVGDDGVLDKTWAEIDAADVAVIVYRGGGIFHPREFVASTEAPDGACIVRTIVQTPTGSVSKAVYITDTADGYPVRQRN